MRDGRIDAWRSIEATRRAPSPRFTRRAILSGAAVLGVLTVSSVEILDAAFSPASADPKRGGVLKAAFSADPAGFDPVRGPSGMSHVVIEQVYSTLMALDPDAKPYPELAESYEVSDDGLQYTFKLRLGVTFHNGDELTAEDVKFSFDRLRAKDSGYSYGVSGRDHRLRRCRGQAHGSLQTVPPDRAFPGLHGLSRQFDRTEEARRVRARPQRQAGGIWAV